MFGPCQSKWDLIPADVLTEAGDIAVEPVTPEMRERFQAAVAQAERFALACAQHLVDCDGMSIAEALVQPEVAAEEALWRSLRGEAVFLDSRVSSWLETREPWSWSEEVLHFAAVQLVLRMIAEEFIRRYRRRRAA